MSDSWNVSSLFSRMQCSPTDGVDYKFYLSRSDAQKPYSISSQKGTATIEYSLLLSTILLLALVATTDLGHNSRFSVVQVGRAIGGSTGTTNPDGAEFLRSLPPDPPQ